MFVRSGDSGTDCMSIVCGDHTTKRDMIHGHGVVKGVVLCVAVEM